MEYQEPTYIIYALVDPTTKQYRYVGKTVDLAKRYRDHIANKEPNNPMKTQWVNDLAKQGLKPELVELEKSPSRWSTKVEQKWIAELTNSGADLFNILRTKPKRE